MFFEEAQQTGSVAPEIVKYVLAGITLLLSNGLTYYLSRPKNQAELAKSKADTNKSEAEATKTRVDTVALLLKEVDEMIQTAQELRAEINKRVAEREKIVFLVNKIIGEVAELIELTISTKAHNLLRMKTVTISERLHKLRETLNIKHD